MGRAGMCLHYTCSAVLSEFLLWEKVLPGADRTCWPQDNAFEHCPCSMPVPQSWGGGRSVILWSVPLSAAGTPQLCSSWVPVDTWSSISKAPSGYCSRKDTELQDRDNAPASALPSVWVFHISCSIDLVQESRHPHPCPQATDACFLCPNNYLITAAWKAFNRWSGAEKILFLQAKDSTKFGPHTPVRPLAAEPVELAIIAEPCTELCTLWAFSLSARHHCRQRNTGLWAAEKQAL